MSRRWDFVLVLVRGSKYETKVRSIYKVDALEETKLKTKI